MTKITFVGAEIIFKVVFITSSVTKISLFVAKITFVVAEMIFKVTVMASL